MYLYLFIGLIVYNILCYADYKLDGKLIAGPSFESYNMGFLNILFGAVCTIILWPIPLTIAFYLDFSRK